LLVERDAFIGLPLSADAGLSVYSHIAKLVLTILVAFAEFERERIRHADGADR
jgi:DNA invertase Pin-like site-specific DNA recombinase